MSDSDLNAVRSRIEAEIEQTEKDIQRLEELTAPIPPDNAIGRLSRMDAINNRSVNEAALDAALLKFSRLQKALGRIDNGSFGSCVSCGGAISPQRLHLMPEADRCMKCTK